MKEESKSRLKYKKIDKGEKMLVEFLEKRG